MAHRDRRAKREDVAGARAAAESRERIRRGESLVRNRLDSDGPQEVVPGRLYISAVGPASDAATLKGLGITHVVCCGREFEPAHPNIAEYIHLKIDDRPHVALDLLLPAALDFIGQALRDLGGPASANSTQSTLVKQSRTPENAAVLVHCMGGRSRSATVVLAYLMREQGIPLAQALKRLQKVRDVINPNVGFLKQLEKFEANGCELERPPARDFIRSHLAYVSQGKTAAGDDIAEIFDELDDRDYQCRTCKVVLFQSSELTHGLSSNSNAALAEGSANGRKDLLCERLFIRYPVPFASAESTVGQEGELCCSNKSCLAVLGGYVWAGYKCQCGEFIAPAFFVFSNALGRADPLDLDYIANRTEAASN